METNESMNFFEEKLFDKISGDDDIQSMIVFNFDVWSLIWLSQLSSLKWLMIYFLSGQSVPIVVVTLEAPFKVLKNGATFNGCSNSVIFTPIF